MTALTEHPVRPPADPVDQQGLIDLAAMLATSPGEAALADPDGTRVRVPAAVHEVLVQAITAMRAGRAITITPLAQRLTAQEAAELLGVSRPTLVRLLEERKLPSDQPGRHRRIRLDDLLAYQERCRKERSDKLAELVRASDELGLYDDVETR